jgi:glycosyltransferase involved in cell wall biosynthesis
MIRAGLIVPFRSESLGGANYYYNLLSCYQRHPDPDLTLAVFTDYADDAAVYRCDAIELHALPGLKSNPLLNYPRRAARRLLHYDPVFLRTLEKQRIDLVTHRRLGEQSKINTLHWQQDFQHKALPGFFDAADCARRDHAINSTLHWGNILLSSQAAANDFRRYYPDLKSVETHVLHFSGASALNEVLLSREQLEAHYPVREPYFFLPNQFWQHKNHGVVVEALRLLPKTIRVICSGFMDDYRNHGYVPELLTRVKEAGVEDRFVCLGVVPYSLLVSLMHHSLAVLQPSLFEGWSTSVEESKALCKQIVLSNLDVHLEQAPERGRFFAPDSPAELAAHMKQIYAEFDPAIEQAFVEQRITRKNIAETEWVVQFAEILKKVA